MPVLCGARAPRDDSSEFPQNVCFHIECDTTLILDLNLRSGSREESRLQVLVIENFLLFHIFFKEIIHPFCQVIDTLV